jgi:hypothetical protein
LLLQALQSGDDSLLEFALGARDAKIISMTLKQIKPTFKLMTRLVSDPLRADCEGMLNTILNTSYLVDQLVKDPESKVGLDKLNTGQPDKCQRVENVRGSGGVSLARKQNKGESMDSRQMANPMEAMEQQELAPKGYRQ